MFKSVIFDWSGTLCDDFSHVFRANNLLFERFGIPALTEADFRREFRLPYMEFYHEYLPGVPRHAIQEAYKRCASGLGPERLFPGARKMLDGMHKNGTVLAILSSTEPKRLAEELRLSGTRQVFAYVESGIHDKRYAAARLMSRAGFDPGRTAFVGDMSHDIDAGRHAGISTIAVTWGYESREKLLKSRPDRIVTSFPELQRLLLGKP